jgi:hypothetical protein
MVARDLLGLIPRENAATYLEMKAFHFCLWETGAKSFFYRNTLKLTNSSSPTHI